MQRQLNNARKFFLFLSKDYLELATDEITALAKMYDRFSKIKVISNLVYSSIQKPIGNEIAKRATFVKVSGQILRKDVRIIFWMKKILGCF